jgi:hypothetical protein
MRSAILARGIEETSNTYYGDIRKQYGGDHWRHFRYRQSNSAGLFQESANVVVSSRRISDGENAAFTTGQDIIVAGGFSAP